MSALVMLLLSKVSLSWQPLLKIDQMYPDTDTFELMKMYPDKGFSTAKLKYPDTFRIRILFLPNSAREILQYNNTVYFAATTALQ